MNIIEAMRDERVFGGLPGMGYLSTWTNWIVCLKAIFGLGMSEPEVEFFRKFTDREAVPAEAFREAFLIVGRRGGKSFISALIAVYLAVFKRWDLGIERGFILCLACDKIQAGIVFDYVGKILELPAFKGMIEAELKEEIQLKNGLTIMVKTASFRSLRGFAICAAILDEVAFYRSEGANPDKEILTAIRPSLGNVPDSLLLAISTPYSKSGILWEAFKKYHGKEDGRRLVWTAGTLAMNPTYNEDVIREAITEDAASARSEYEAVFRADLETFVNVEALDAVIVPERRELPFVFGLKYSAFCDPSGGRVDSMTLAIVHREDEKIIQDVVRIVRPPFNPTEAVEALSKTLKFYGLKSVSGDRYSGEWVVEAFRKNGITYKNATLSKSEIYLEFLPMIMTGSVELLDNRQQKVELRQLERRTGQQRDAVDHPRGLHDDVANAIAGACVFAIKKGGDFGFRISERPAY